MVNFVLLYYYQSSSLMYTAFLIKQKDNILRFGVMQIFVRLNHKLFFFIFAGELALCGESLDINFLLPFTHFQQEESELKFFFCGETLVLRSFVPESNTLRKSIISLAKNSDRHMYPKTSARQPSESAEYDQPDGLDMYDEVDNGVNLEDQLSKGWRRRTGGTTAWIDVWSVPVIILNLFYKYHVIVPEDDVTKTINEHCGIENKAKEPLDLSPDRFTIELEAGPSAIRIFGHFWRQFFLGFKVIII